MCGYWCWRGYRQREGSVWESVGGAGEDDARTGAGISLRVSFSVRCCWLVSRTVETWERIQTVGEHKPNLAQFRTLSSVCCTCLSDLSSKCALRCFLRVADKLLYFSNTAYRLVFRMHSSVLSDCFHCMLFSLMFFLSHYT